MPSNKSPAMDSCATDALPFLCIDLRLFSPLFPLLVCATDIPLSLFSDCLHVGLAAVKVGMSALVRNAGVLLLPGSKGRAKISFGLLQNV